MPNLVATTPIAISAMVLELCRNIDATQTPQYAPVALTEGYTEANCFPNVIQHIAKYGGGIQYGWMIWENPNIIIEGEFHAVWVNNEGKFIDITPKVDKEQRILFLPDSSKVYHGVPVDNIRMVLTRDPTMLALFEFQSEVAKLRAKYNIDGEVSKIPAEELQRLVFKKDRVVAQQHDLRRNAPCNCGSGKKYKKCCGRGRP